MPNQPCYFLFTSWIFQKTSFLIISIIVPMYQFFLPIDKKARHGFLDRRYFSQVAIQHTSKMFFSIERVHPLSAWKEKWCFKPGSEICKVFEVSCRDWGCIFPTVLRVLFKIVGIPRVTDLGNDGGLQKKSICFKHLQDQKYCHFYN